MCTIQLQYFGSGLYQQIKHFIVYNLRKWMTHVLTLWYCKLYQFMITSVVSCRSNQNPHFIHLIMCILFYFASFVQNIFHRLKVISRLKHTLSKHYTLFCLWMLCSQGRCNFTILFKTLVAFSFTHFIKTLVKDSIKH